MDNDVTPIASIYFEDTIFANNEAEYIIRPVKKCIVPIVEQPRIIYR